MTLDSQVRKHELLHTVYSMRQELSAALEPIQRVDATNW